ncbi:MAG: DNA alkylation repair protein [Gemmataceae bacterium]
MTIDEARARLHAHASPEVAVGSARYFKTGPGEYGEGDIFIGVRVPMLRKLARECQALPLNDVEGLLQSPIHEERLLALLILVRGVSRCEDPHRKLVYDLYCRNMKYVNNWDLVDTSAPAIVGGYLSDRPRTPLYRWAKSPALWERRIAIIATQHFIRRGEFADTIAICQLLISDREDLIHKATGWMLREMGNRDESVLHQFLDKFAAVMPRTMLRYAIEKFDPDVRRLYLNAARPSKR